MEMTTGKIYKKESIVLHEKEQNAIAKYTSHSCVASPSI